MLYRAPRTVCAQKAKTTAQRRREAQPKRTQRRQTGVSAMETRNKQKKREKQKEKKRKKDLMGSKQTETIKKPFFLQGPTDFFVFLVLFCVFLPCCSCCEWCFSQACCNRGDVLLNTLNGQDYPFFLAV